MRMCTPRRILSDHCYLFKESLVTVVYEAGFAWNCLDREAFYFPAVVVLLRARNYGCDDAVLGLIISPFVVASIVAVKYLSQLAIKLRDYSGTVWSVWRYPVAFGALTGSAKGKLTPHRRPLGLQGDFVAMRQIS
jgi:hypothetical protein